MYIKYVVIGLLFFLGSSLVMVVAQKDAKAPTKQTNTDSEKRMAEILNEQAIFSKLSSVKTEMDEGYCVIAIRKVIVWLNSPDDDSPSSRIKKELVQIELQAKGLPAPRDFGNNEIQIGDQLFDSYKDDCKNKADCLMVSMSVKEFDDLKDNSLISLSNIYIDSKRLKDSYKNGEPKEIFGVKFGRLDKKMIYKFPVVEINKP
jgi:hypothetical protein